MTCADGGYLVCKKAGIKPDAVIGDFDSLTEEQIREIDELGIERIVYPAEKGETDTLLCVSYGLKLGAAKFLIVGGIGGDFGHTMANIQVLSFLSDMECEAEITTCSNRLLMVSGAAPMVINGAPGGKFSVFSYTERCSGVSIKNAKYELNDAALTQSFPLGVSNEFTEKGPVNIAVKHGRLLVIIG